MPHPSVVSEPIAGHAPAEPPSFRCTVQSNGGDAWIGVVGELDLATSPQLQDALREAELYARRIVLDLRELAFLDTSGIHVIVDASHRLRQSRHRLVLVRGPSPVDRLFALTGTTAVLDIVDLDPSEPPAQALRRAAYRAAA